MAINLPEQIIIDIIEHELLHHRHIRLGVLRLDLIHPLVSGNKWFKLKENIGDALAKGYKSLLTFGGAYSNHLIATAAAAKENSLQSVGIIRGFHGRDNPSETLRQCTSLGMQLQYISRDDYRQKEEEVFLATLRLQYPDAYLIPEGGNNINGLKGAGTIAAYIPDDTTCVALAVGTGTTFAGIRNQLDSSVVMLGFPVMRDGIYLKEEIEAKLYKEQDNWALNAGYHFGGFAKHNPGLLNFMNDFYAQHKLPLDMVYTAKMMYGIFDLLEKGFFPEGSNIVCIHTGGLQGNSTVRQYLRYPDADS